MLLVRPLSMLIYIKRYNIVYGIKGEFMARDDFTEATKKLLAERVGYICSNPFCRRVTVGPQIGGEKTVNIGEAAHICAASPGGKRYDPEMTSDKRKSVDNGIWMCRTHAALIDRDEKYFTVEMLKKMERRC